MSSENMVEVESKDMAVKECVPCSVDMGMDMDMDNESYYRKMRELDQKDELAIRVLNSPIEAIGVELKTKAINHLLNRF